MCCGATPLHLATGHNDNPAVAEVLLKPVPMQLRWIRTVSTHTAGTAGTRELQLDRDLP